jgi:type VI secretion system secreted protein VgrG
MPPPTSTFTSSLEITVNGVTIRRVNYLRINQRFETHHGFEISVSPATLGQQAEDLRSLADTIVGKRISINLSQSRPGQQAQNNLFVGVVMAVRLIKGQSQTSGYLITGSSLSRFLSIGPSTRSYTDKALADIIQFPDGWGLCSPAFTTTIPYVTQYDEDRFHFYQRLADRYGEWFYYNGEKMIFGKSARPSAPTIELIQGRNLFDMEYGLRITPVRWKASYFNYESFQRFDGDASGEQVSGLSSLAQLMLDRSDATFADAHINDIGYSDFATATDLNKALRVERSERANRLAIISGRTPEMELKIGNLVSVADPTYENGSVTNEGSYGELVVTALNHYIDSSGVYQAHFECIPQDTDMPPVNYNIIPRRATPQLGVVKDTADPSELGRVKVQFWWQGNGRAPEEATTPWIRVASAMTSHSKSYFIPEVDDTVMVDFEYGNPDLPYVTGSLYANDGGPRKPGAELFRADNHIKGIITKGGNHIIIDDENGKEKIKIFNKENKNKIELSLDGGSHINIHSDGTINMSATNINIKASEELKMEGKNLVKIESDTLIDAKSQDVITLYGVSKAGIGSDDKCLSSGARVGITATSEMKVESATIEVSADATAAIKAGGQLSLEGTGMAELKGGMVMIN